MGQRLLTKTLDEVKELDDVGLGVFLVGLAGLISPPPGCTRKLSPESSQSLVGALLEASKRLVRD